MTSWLREWEVPVTSWAVCNCELLPRASYHVRDQKWYADISARCGRLQRFLQSCRLRREGSGVAADVGPQHSIVSCEVCPQQSIVSFEVSSLSWSVNLNCSHHTIEIVKYFPQTIRVWNI